MKYFVDNELELLQSDKEDMFVAMAEGHFQGRAFACVNKNCEERPSVNLSKQKKAALALCNDLNLSKLAAAVKGSKGVFFVVLFTVKTHNLGDPFRAIISEKMSWQVHF